MGRGAEPALRIAPMERSHTAASLQFWTHHTGNGTSQACAIGSQGSTGWSTVASHTLRRATVDPLSLCTLDVQVRQFPWPALPALDA